MHNILFISSGQNFMTQSLIRQIESKEYIVTSIPLALNDINEVTIEVAACIVYIDDKVMKSAQELVFLKDKALEKDMPVILIGDPEELANVTNTMGKSHITKAYTRPINIPEVVADLDAYVKVNGYQNKKKILVVDDSGPMLRNVKGWLEDKYHVVLANSAAMAIKYLSLNRPDLVLLDYEMPVVDGKQTLEMIRSESEFSDLPVIFLTSKGDKESVLEVMALKPEGYLLKTLSPDEIRKAIDDFFAKQKAMK